MEKPVRAVIASARANIGVFSQNKLPDETMRLLLHNVVTDYINEGLMKGDDRFLHEVSCGVAPDEEGGDYIVYFEDAESASGEVREFLPHTLFYKDKTDPHGTKYKVYLSTLDNFALDIQERYHKHRQPVGVFYGNNYDRNSVGIRLKLSLSPDAVERFDWTVLYKRPLSSIIGYDEMVPFPASHIGMIETTLAIRALDVVNDSSADWERKYIRLKTSLAAVLLHQQHTYDKYLKGEIKTRTRSLPQYDYRNRRFNSRRKIEPLGE